MADATPPDIGRLKIDRGCAPSRASRRRKWISLGVAAVAVIAGGAWYAVQPHPVEVTTTAVVTSYPSQQFVQLNASGYVVAQRKAAIASKATGRLEWLGVREGSLVKDSSRARRNNKARLLTRNKRGKRGTISSNRMRNNRIKTRGVIATASARTSFPTTPMVRTS